MAKLYFYYSTMNAGKSTTLLQSSYNYNEKGMDTLIFTPAIDDRAGVGKVASRIGLEANAIPFDDEFNFFDYIGRAKQKSHGRLTCILIDEAQFLNREQVEQLGEVVDVLNLPVLTYGLRSDFRGDAFSGSLYLLTLADELVEIKTICHCGSKATMNMRVDSQNRKVLDGQQVEIGGNERYIACCRRHFRTGQASSTQGATDNEVLLQS